MKKIPVPAASSTALKRIILVISLGSLVLGAFGFWVYNLYYLQTEDAYINAHVVQVAPKVTGQIVNLPVEDNQLVRKGQLLFEIDPQPFRIAVEKAQAIVDKAQASFEVSSLIASRIGQLAKNRVRSAEDQDKAMAALQEATATLRQAKAGLAQEQLNLSYTKIAAPVAGWVTMLKVRQGSIVEADRALFALVDKEGFWIDANFKETELKYIYPGQEVDIEVDMYPGHFMKGEVDSISRGSGAAFSLLPAQNATGNWVKVTQRVPVKIRVLEESEKFPLRIGTTATVTIKLDPWKKKESANG